MSSAICFNLDQSKILLSGNDLNSWKLVPAWSEYLYLRNERNIKYYEFLHNSAGNTERWYMYLSLDWSKMEGLANQICSLSL